MSVGFNETHSLRRVSTAATHRTPTASQIRAGPPLSTLPPSTSVCLAFYDVPAR